MAQSRALAAGVGALVLLIAGCSATTSYGEQRIGKRVDNLVEAGDMLAAHERDSVSNLEYDARFIDSQLRGAADELGDNLSEADRLFRRDAKRWIDNQPYYRREFERIMRGHPEQIEKNAIDLFY
ncbi:MAG: hypothetical protein U1D55_03450 [Phycisphaerae bacterium]